MRRMVDDKEMITINNRITALEEGGGGSSDTAKKLQDTAAGQTGVVQVVDEEEYATLFLGIKGENEAVYKNYVDVSSDGTVALKANDSFEFGVQGNKGSFFAAKQNDIEITPDTGYDVNIKVGNGGNLCVTQTGQGTLVKKPVALAEDIPTDTSDLTNNAGFITIADVPVPTAGTGIDILNGQISVDNTVAMKTDITDYYAGTNVYFTPHSGADGYDITVPMKTINGNPINGIGNITIAALTEKFFRVNINWGNPVSRTWYYTFRAEASLDTSLTGTAALSAYVPEGAIVYNPDDKCLYTIVSIVPNSMSTIAKYDGTTETMATAGFISTTVQAV